MKPEAFQNKLISLLKSLKAVESIYVGAKDEDLANRITAGLRRNEDSLNMAVYVQHVTAIYSAAYMLDLVSDSVEVKQSALADELAETLSKQPDLLKQLDLSQFSEEKLTASLADEVAALGGKGKPRTVRQSTTMPKLKSDKPQKPRAPQADIKEEAAPKPKPKKRKPEAKAPAPKAEEKFVSPRVYERPKTIVSPLHQSSEKPKTKEPSPEIFKQSPEERAFNRFKAQFPNLGKLVTDLGLNSFDAFETEVLGHDKPMGLDKIMQRNDPRRFLGHLQTKTQAFADKNKITLPKSMFMIAMDLSKDLKDFGPKQHRG